MRPIFEKSGLQAMKEWRGESEGVVEGASEQEKKRELVARERKTDDRERSQTCIICAAESFTCRHAWIRGR